MHEIRKRLLNVFSENEILTEEKFCRFFEKKKVVIFVPEEFADKLLVEMSKTGAGIIGDYEMCSFRILGTGTYKPGKDSNPFKGKINRLSYEEELRFEIECDAGKLNSVLDAMLEHHPYEETAYEIYNFFRREKESTGIIVTLRKKILHKDLLKRLNKKIDTSGKEDEISYKKIAFTENDADENLIMSAQILECDCIITGSKNSFKLFKIL
ncbi:MAG: hypothetical protein KDD00_16855 [Ignavibacteriae bacterium]|nr:hypothetical protein [Ignavibacteriota bacterium]